MIISFINVLTSWQLSTILWRKKDEIFSSLEISCIIRMTIPWCVINCFDLPMGEAFNTIMHTQPSYPNSFTHQISSDSHKWLWQSLADCYRAIVLSPGNTEDTTCFTSISAHLAMVIWLTFLFLNQSTVANGEAPYGFLRMKTTCLCGARNFSGWLGELYIMIHS